MKLTLQNDQIKINDGDYADGEKLSELYGKWFYDLSKSQGFNLRLIPFRKNDGGVVQAIVACKTPLSKPSRDITACLKKHIGNLCRKIESDREQKRKEDLFLFLNEKLAGCENIKIEIDGEEFESSFSGVSVEHDPAGSRIIINNIMIEI